jgi:hypothetical protein
MSPRLQLALHSIVAVVIFAAVMVGVTALGYWLGGLQGLRGKAFDNWMVGAALTGIALGLAAFFGYRGLMPKGLLGFVEEMSPERREQVRAHAAALAAVDARQEALRKELRATHGLERYAELVGRSSIGSVDDARKREARVAELRADPVKAKYAERVFQGEAITDVMIAYWEDPSARVLCTHFGNLEADIRKAAPRAHPTGANTLTALLAFDFDKLRARYGLGPPVTFWRRPFGPEFYGRAEENYDGLEVIECGEHRCRLEGSAHWKAFPAPASPP